MSRAGRALGPTAEISALAAFADGGAAPDLPVLLTEEVDQPCGNNLAPTNSALFWLLLAIADFSPRKDDTGIPECGAIPPCHRDAWTPLGRYTGQRQLVHQWLDVDWQGATLYSLYLAPW